MDDRRTQFDLMIGRLDRLLSEFLDAARNGSLDEPDRQTIKHHADDLIGVGNAALTTIGKRGVEAVPDLLDHVPDLLDHLASFAYEYRPDRPFTLASGQTSEDYLDCRRAFSMPGALRQLGSVIVSHLLPEVVSVGGLTMGADPLAISASMVEGRPIRWFSVRKEPKAHGQRRLIEGDLRSGDVVAIVDDVVTSGDSTLRAIQACTAFGADIAQVLILVDREQGGMDCIRRAVPAHVPVHAIFTKTQIRQRWLALGQNHHTGKPDTVGTFPFPLSHGWVVTNGECPPTSSIALVVLASSDGRVELVRFDVGKRMFIDSLPYPLQQLDREQAQRLATLVYARLPGFPLD